MAILGLPLADITKAVMEPKTVQFKTFLLHVTQFVKRRFGTFYRFAVGPLIIYVVAG